MNAFLKDGVRGKMRRGPADPDAEADCDKKKTGPIKKSENSCFLKPTFLSRFCKHLQTFSSDHFFFN
jgi:hypothetical protein